MKQTNDLSTLVAGMVTEVVTGVITGVTSARRHYYRNLLLVAIVVAGVTFAITVLFRNDLPGDIRNSGAEPHLRARACKGSAARANAAHARRRGRPSTTDSSESDVKRRRPNVQLSGFRLWRR